MFWHYEVLLRLKTHLYPICTNSTRIENVDFIMSETIECAYLYEDDVLEMYTRMMCFLHTIYAQTKRNVEAPLRRALLNESHNLFTNTQMHSKILLSLCRHQSHVFLCIESLKLILIRDRILENLVDQNNTLNNSKGPQK